MYLTHSVELRAQTTLHLTQTMRLMGLNTADLAAEIQSEIENNPVLQMVEDHRCPNCGRRLKTHPCPTCLNNHTGDGPIVFLSSRLPTARAVEDDDELPANRIAQTDSLAEHILSQVACMVSAAERRLAMELLARLDDQGLLTDSPAELAQALRAPLETITHILHLIQHSDPPGVGTRDGRQSFLAQLETIAETRPVPPLCQTLITDHWLALAQCRHAGLAKRLGVAVAEVKEAALFIGRNLTPYPARAWHDSGRGTHRPARDVYYEPDIVISHNPRPGGPLMVEVFTGLTGSLRLDPEIKAALPDLTEEEKGEWSDYVDRATLWVKCVQQRNHTMRRIAEIITTEQAAFILGADSDLKPLTRSALARQLELHESTVSRAVANKSAALPNGRIVPLSTFFDRSLAARDAVQSIINQEDRAAPLSDTEIAQRLKQQGYAVARRTVAKYRQMNGILPAPLRAREREMATLIR